MRHKPHILKRLINARLKISKKVHSRYQFQVHDILPISLDESPQQLSKESHAVRTCMQICAYYDAEHKSDPPFLIGSNPMASSSKPGSID